MMTVWTWSKIASFNQGKIIIILFLGNSLILMLAKLKILAWIPISLTSLLSFFALGLVIFQFYIFNALCPNEIRKTPQLHDYLELHKQHLITVGSKQKYIQKFNLSNIFSPINSPVENMINHVYCLQNESRQNIRIIVSVCVFFSATVFLIINIFQIFYSLSIIFPRIIEKIQHVF